MRILIADDEKEFASQFAKHKELSRTATVGKFKGGLADHSEQVIKYHTATHLLNKALHIVLGEHVSQKGSNLTEERARYELGMIKEGEIFVQVPQQMPATSAAPSAAPAPASAGLPSIQTRR